MRHQYEMLTLKVLREELRRVNRKVYKQISILMSKSILGLNLIYEVRKHVYA